MNNNGDNSNNNNDNNINSKDDNNYNLNFLYCFFAPCLNVFKLFRFIEPGNLFHTEGQIHERLFCFMLVFRK